MTIALLLVARSVHRGRKENKLKNVGLVLNGIGAKDKYGYGYQYGYGYSSET